MAKSETTPTTTTESVEAAPAPKSNKKLVILVVAAFLAALAIGGGATFFLMSRQAHDEGDDEEEVVVEKPKKAEKKKAPPKETFVPVYAALDAFTVNLAPENGDDQFLHVILSIEIADQLVGDKIKSYTPKLRNNIMLLLSSKKASELMSAEGKKKLASEIRDLMNEIVEPGSSRERPEHASVKDVLFTTFIIQ